MAEIRRVDGGTYINGKFTSDDAIQDCKNWGSCSPEDAAAIFDYVINKNQDLYEKLAPSDQQKDQMEITLKIPCTEEEIKLETEKLRNQIFKLSSEEKLLRQAIKHYQSLCDHKGQKTGYNDRDGSWGSPCPTCGYSY